MNLEGNPQPTQQLDERHKLVRLFDAIGLDEFATSPNERLKMIHGMSEEQFLSFATRCNGIIRDIPISKRSMDGNGFVASGNFGFIVSGDDVLFSNSDGLIDLPPPQEVRSQLMSEAFSVAKEMDDLDKMATMLGLAINLIHPFSDGNGRTSRLIYTLISHGYNGSPEDQKLLEDILVNVRGRGIVDLDPKKVSLSKDFSDIIFNKLKTENGGKVLPKRIIDAYKVDDVGMQNPKNINLGQNISPENCITFHKLLRDPLGPAAIMTFMVLKKIPWGGSILIGNAVAPFVDGSILFPQLTNKDVEEIAKNHGYEKEAMINWVINSFVDPDYQSKIDDLVDVYKPQAINN